MIKQEAHSCSVLTGFAQIISCPLSHCRMGYTITLQPLATK